MHADLLDVIRSYRSTDLDNHPRAALVYPVIQQIVIDAAPDEQRTARQALLRCAKFFIWEIDRSPDAAISSSSLTDERVEEYLNDTMSGRPTGSVNAERSYLKRCIGGASLTRTGRHGTLTDPPRPHEQSPAPVGSRSSPPRESQLRPRRRPTTRSTFPRDLTATRTQTGRQVDHEAIEAACVAWAPDDMTADEWASVRPTCLEWVRAAAPGSESRAVQIMRNVGWLLLWGSDRGLDAGELLKISTVNSYLADEQPAGPTAESIRSNMDVVIAALNPEETWGKRSTGGRAAVVPYSDAQVDWFWQRTTHMGPKLRRAARGLLVLGAGFGFCRGPAPSKITGDDLDVSRDLPTLLVDRYDYVVELAIIERWAQRCESVLAECPSGQPLLGTRNRQRAQTVADELSDTCGQRCSLERLRGNWKLNALCAPQSIATAADAVGMRSLAGFNAVVPYLPAHRGSPLGGEH